MQQSTKRRSDVGYEIAGRIKVSTDADIPGLSLPDDATFKITEESVFQPDPKFFFPGIDDPRKLLSFTYFSPQHGVALLGKIDSALARAQENEAFELNSFTNLLCKCSTCSDVDIYRLRLILWLFFLHTAFTFVHIPDQDPSDAARLFARTPPIYHNANIILVVTEMLVNTTLTAASTMPATTLTDALTYIVCVTINRIATTNSVKKEIADVCTTVMAKRVHRPVLTTFVTKAMRNVGNSTTTTIFTSKGTEQAAKLMGPIETTKQAAQRNGKSFYTSLSQSSYFRSFWRAYGIQE
jgi:hypothetical protein